MSSYSSSSPRLARGRRPDSVVVRPELLQEVKLANNLQDREKYDNMADLFAIISTIELLEKAYIRDSITPAEYTPACEKLIAQYKTAQNLVKEHIQDLESFMAEYHMNCPAAVSRLTIGVPATIEHGGLGEAEAKKNAKYAAECTQHFISLMDSLKLNMYAVDQIHPYLNDLMESMNKLSSLPPTFEGKVKVKEWLTVLNKMKASDELSEEQVRQLSFDLESAYNAFHKSL
eukprot:Colp12_sorted_trinity150504_noHs@11820